MRPMTMGEVRLNTAKAARFSASALSTGAFDDLPPTQSMIYRCPRRPKRRSSPKFTRNRGMSDKAVQVHDLADNGYTPIQTTSILSSVNYNTTAGQAAER
jgi:hypothetical protein